MLSVIPTQTQGKSHSRLAKLPTVIDSIEGPIEERFEPGLPVAVQRLPGQPGFLLPNL